MKPDATGKILLILAALLLVAAIFVSGITLWLKLLVTAFIAFIAGAAIQGGKQ